jgi:tetratricopeptide (TPR) repeat protein
MRKVFYSSSVILVLWFFFACASHTGQVPIDQIPEYDGIDRNAIPELKAGDEWFIEGLTKKFGSREKASKAFSERGMELYKQDNLEEAMKRFNQAWLLDENNYEAYWGFGVVMHDKKMAEESLKWLEKAYALNSNNAYLIADLAVMKTEAGRNQKYTETERMEIFKNCDLLFKKAISLEPNNSYIYYQKARALYAQKKFNEALMCIQKYKDLGGKEPMNNWEHIINQAMKKYQ